MRQLQGKPRIKGRTAREHFAMASRALLKSERGKRSEIAAVA
jgi:hypothetical protein